MSHIVELKCILKWDEPASETSWKLHCKRESADFGGAGDMAHCCKWNDLYISGRKEWENLGVFILRTRILVFLFSIFGVNYLEQSPSGLPIFWCVPICSGILPFVNLAPTTNHQLYCWQSTKPPNFVLWETTQAWLVWIGLVRFYLELIGSTIISPYFWRENAGAVFGWLAIALQSNWNTN